MQSKNCIKKASFWQKIIHKDYILACPSYKNRYKLIEMDIGKFQIVDLPDHLFCFRMSNIVSAAGADTSAQAGKLERLT